MSFLSFRTPIGSRQSSSRLVVDVERFRDDNQEPMVEVGMGAIYTHGFDRTLIRQMSASQKAKLLTAYYDPHHELLTSTVDEMLRLHGDCLIVDCHSFPSTRLPYEIGKHGARPEVQIGTDSFHTPSAIVEVARRWVDLAGSHLV